MNVVFQTDLQEQVDKLDILIIFFIIIVKVNILLMFVYLFAEDRVEFQIMIKILRKLY